MKSATRYMTAVAVGVLASSSTFAGVTQRAGDNIIETTYTAEFVRSDLETQVGARAAYAQLRALARRACSDSSSDFVRHAVNFEEARCVSTALEGAVKQLDASLVTAIHNDRF